MNANQNGKKCIYSSVPLKDRVQVQLNRVNQILPNYTVTENDNARNMRSIRIITGDSQF